MLDEVRRVIGLVARCSRLLVLFQKAYVSDLTCDFDRYFYSSPMIQSVLREANLKGRRAIRISNPNLNENTPLSRKELWFNPEQYDGDAR